MPVRAPAGPGRDAPRAIVVMAKSLDSGETKTRLAPILPDAAHRRWLARAFLLDVLATCRAIRGIDLRLATTSRTTAAVSGIPIERHERLVQRGADLGERERHVFQDLARQGFSTAVMIGSDLPTLPAERVRLALSALLTRRRTVVLGPADDGGYYLMGMRLDAGVPDLFSAIRWSTRHTYSDTARAARRHGLRLTTLPRWHDVDTPQDLQRLARELRDRDTALRARATHAVLTALLGPAA